MQPSQPSWALSCRGSLAPCVLLLQGRLWTSTSSTRHCSHRDRFAGQVAEPCVLAGDRRNAETARNGKPELARILASPRAQPIYIKKYKSLHDISLLFVYEGSGWPMGVPARYNTGRCCANFPPQLSQSPSAQAGCGLRALVMDGVVFLWSAWWWLLPFPTCGAPGVQNTEPFCPKCLH